MFVSDQHSASGVFAECPKSGEGHALRVEIRNAPFDNLIHEKIRMEHLSGASFSMLEAGLSYESLHRYKCALTLHSVVAKTVDTNADGIMEVIHRDFILSCSIAKCVLEVIAVGGEMKERLFVPCWLYGLH